MERILNSLGEQFALWVLRCALFVNVLFCCWIVLWAAENTKLLFRF